MFDPGRFTHQPNPPNFALQRSKAGTDFMEWFVVCHGVVWNPNKPEDPKKEKEEKEEFKT